MLVEKAFERYQLRLNSTTSNASMINRLLGVYGVAEQNIEVEVCGPSLTYTFQ